jgi:hypothetical protein
LPQTRGIVRRVNRKNLGITFDFSRSINNQVMAKDLHLQFIRERIQQLRTAVMYSMSDSIFKLPNDIVTALRVDNEGQLWFICRAYLPVEECEQSFPARLRFYKKGYDFHVEVSGKATIVNTDYSDYKNIGKEKDKRDSDKFILIKMTMTSIEYTEPHTKKPKGKLELMLENSYKWFLKTAAFKPHSVSVLAKLHHTNYYGKNPTYNS